jgi:protoporphyrinogen oxidase
MEDLTAQEWLVRLGGEEVYHTVWEPLLLGKFGPYAREISAVWMWNKLKLRGGSRGRWGAETLAYYRGGFAALLEKMVAEIRMRGGEVHTALSVDGLISDGCQVRGVTAGGHTLEADAVVATTALPAVAQYLEPHVDLVYTAQLRRIEYLANVCLVLVLDRQLSDVYWLNVTDPGFPFVGIIEHTNLESSDTYGGRHIIYLSKYLMPSDPLFSFSGGQVLKHALPHLEQMFPGFHVSWIVDYRVWSSLYAQPVVVRHFSRLVPAPVTPLRGFFICTMAQIYPEDRGTNYAIREGRRMSRLVAAFLGKTSS